MLFITEKFMVSKLNTTSNDFPSPQSWQKTENNCFAGTVCQTMTAHAMLADIPLVMLLAGHERFIFLPFWLQQLLFTDNTAI